MRKLRFVVLGLAFAACDPAGHVDEQASEEALSLEARLTLSPSQVTVTPGSYEIVTVTLSSGGPRSRTWDLGALGLPVGVTAVFDPPAIRAGEAARLTISVAQGVELADRPYLVLASDRHMYRVAPGRVSAKPAPATFTCSGSDGTVVQDITGALDANDRPVIVTFTTTQAGFGVVSRYTVVRAADVAAADVAGWASSLHMAAWDVTAPPADNPDLDSAYLFLPTGAHTGSAFPGFSYVLLAGGSSGNLQITLDCRGTGTAGRSVAPRPFTCGGNDGPIVETIDGTFDLAARPTALTFTMKRSGFAASYTLPTAAEVADTDPNAADLASFAAQLGMAPWDVTPLLADNPDGDLAYVLFPTGAQNLSVFQAFYYDLFAGGAAGNLQMTLTCTPR